MLNQYLVYYNENKLDDETKKFLIKWHYSKSYSSLKQKHIFKLVDQYNNLVGVAVYGSPAMKSHQDKIELRRLCLIDDTPRNAESFFIAKTLKWLAKNTKYDQVISFADPNHGHQGIIYKASNFMYDGLEKNNPRVVQYGDKQIHLRQMYQKKAGDYSQDAKRIQALVEAGQAQVLNQERKHRYIYDLRR